MLKTLVIPHVLLSNFTYLANHVASGLPALTALTGFGKNLALQVTRCGVPVEFHSASLAIRAPATFSGHARFLRSLREEKGDLTAARDPDKGSNFHAPVIDDQKASMVVDLLVLLRVDEDSEADLTEELLTAVVRSLRFSSAEMRTVKGRPVSAKLFGDFQKALNMLPGATLMVEDASATLKDYADQSGQSLKDAFLALIERKKKSLTEVASDAEESERPVGYFVPAATGFALLEAPTKREGTRAPQLLHAFAEPLLGLVRIRQVASIRTQFRKHFENRNDPSYVSPSIFWRMSAQVQAAGHLQDEAGRQLVYAKGAP